MTSAFYLDTSVILRATLETGTSPELEAKLAAASVLVTSRLAPVESARALLRARLRSDVSESRFAAAERDIDALWNRCEIWELTTEVCDLASRVAPRTSLRTLDALHLATFLAARRRIAGLQMLTADRRLSEAVRAET